MKTQLDELINFIKLTHEVRGVKRAIILDNNTYENDAEHSYQLALTAWFIIKTQKLDLDLQKCMAMALVHDTVEIHAGDTQIFADKDAINSKADREAKAVKKLKLDWPNLEPMHELIEEYKSLKSPEAKFVYSLDKLIPTINNYLYGGKTWRKGGINLDRINSVKAGKVDRDKLIKAYNDELTKILKAHPELFGKPKGKLND